MKLKFVYVGKNNNDEMLIIDTNDKTFLYVANVTLENTEAKINVKSKKEIRKILDVILDDGYAFKI